VLDAVEELGPERLVERVPDARLGVVVRGRGPVAEPGDRAPTGSPVASRVKRGISARKRLPSSRTKV
jgi:hypothetical protein